MCEKREVWFVDDHRDLPELLEMLFTSHGYQNAKYVGDARAAKLRLKEGQRPCMMIVDVDMPVVSGPEFIDWVRKQPDVALADTPLILFTGFDKHSIAGLDIDDFIRKGSTEERFFEVAKEQIARHYLHPPKGQRVLPFPFTGFLTPREFRQWEHHVSSQPPERRRTPREAEPETPPEDPKQMRLFGENMEPFDYARSRYLDLLETKKKPKVGVGTIAYHAGRGIVHSAQAAIGAGAAGLGVAYLHPATRHEIATHVVRHTHPDRPHPDHIVDVAPDAATRMAAAHNEQRRRRHEVYTAITAPQPAIAGSLAAITTGGAYAHQHSKAAYDAFKSSYQAYRHRFHGGPAPKAEPKRPPAHTEPLSPKHIRALKQIVGKEK